MDSEVKEALAGVKSAWKNMLTAKDIETYNFWNNELKKIDFFLHEESKKIKKQLTLLTIKQCKGKKGPGRPSKYKSISERQIERQKYQHEYYLRVTKQKRAERRKYEATK